MPTIEAPQPSTGLLGKGLYSQKEAAEIIGLRLPGIKRQTIAYWMYGDTSESVPPAPVFVPELDLPQGERVLTFLDLIEHSSVVKDGMSKEELVQDLSRAQMVMSSIAQPFFRSVEYDYEALQYWPLNRSQGIILDPNRQFGKPIIATAGIPTKIIYEISQRGESIENIADWYEVSVNEVLDAIELETKLHDVPLR